MVNIPDFNKWRNAKKKNSTNKNYEPPPPPKKKQRQEQQNMELIIIIPRKKWLKSLKWKQNANFLKRKSYL